MILWKHRCYRIGLPDLRKNLDLTDAKLNGLTKWSGNNFDSNKCNLCHLWNLRVLFTLSLYCPKCHYSHKSFRHHNLFIIHKCLFNKLNTAHLHLLIYLHQRAKRCNLNEKYLLQCLLIHISQQNPLERFLGLKYQSHSLFQKQ